MDHAHPYNHQYLGKFPGRLAPHNVPRRMLDGTIQKGVGPLQLPPVGLWPVEVVVQVISTCPSRFAGVLIGNRITNWYCWGATWLHVFGPTKLCKKNTGKLNTSLKLTAKSPVTGKCGTRKRKGSSSDHPFFRCELLVSEKVRVASCVSQKHIVFCAVFFHLPDGFAPTNSIFPIRVPLRCYFRLEFHPSFHL